MVTGNVYTALQNLIALGSDNQWNGSCYTPSLIVDSLSVVRVRLWRSQIERCSESAPELKLLGVGLIRELALQ
jgi:hypothetical protein